MYNVHSYPTNYQVSVHTSKTLEVFKLNLLIDGSTQPKKLRIIKPLTKAEKIWQLVLTLSFPIPFQEGDSYINLLKKSYIFYL